MIRAAMNTIPWRTFWILLLAAASMMLLLPRHVTQRVYDPVNGRMHDTVVRRVPIKLGLDLKGGVHMALEVDRSKQPDIDCADAIRRAERVVRTRIDEFGTSEPVVQVAGDCRLIVELPGVTDLARAKAVVQRTAFLEFRLTDPHDAFRRAIPAMGTRMSSLLGVGSIPGEALVAESNVRAVDSLLARPEVARLVPHGLELKWSSRTIGAGGEPYRALYAVATRPITTGEELQEATAAIDPMTNAPEVQFELTRTGGRRFGEATSRNIGNHLAILLDGRVHDRPAVIESRIDSRGRIRMAGQSLEEANDLALLLRAGALPAPLHVVAEGTLGPSLGQDSIRDGVRASLLAVGFVFVVMAIYYGFSGLLAVVGLLLYVLYSLGGLAALGFTLTLPGLAGFALSIGMAVDANVLIFERIREEMDAGKMIRAAVNDGFRHAMSAIVDSNVTTALTAAALYAVGTESVRGFAITLLIGIGASMISAVFVTRTFFLVWLKRKPAMTRLHGFTLRLFANAKYDFVGMRRLAYGVTAAIIVPGLVLLAARGVTYSIEFTGGAMLQVRTASPVGTAVIRSALERGGLASAEIQSFGSDRSYVIRARLDGETEQTEAVTAAARTALDLGLGAERYVIERSEGVGPKVGGELRQKALIAILFSFAATLVYLAARFEWRFGLAAIIATAHDILATIAFIRYLDLEVSLVVVAALLTVLGYSLNDTIVIFDRVRENLRRNVRASFVAVLNQSINETLPRTILTGGTTLATALVLSFVAGEVIKPFAQVMTFGIVVGTFSSVFVAAPVLLWIRGRWGSERAAAVPPVSDSVPRSVSSR
jgi:SecD/SecF fusion protein